MALDPPDRSGDRKQNFTHHRINFDGHSSASEMSDSWPNTWMAGPAHSGAYEHIVHHSDMQGVRKPHTYDRTFKSDENGVRGIVGIKGPFANFIPDSDIESYYWKEREGVPDSAIREQNYRESRQREGYDD